MVGFTRACHRARKNGPRLLPESRQGNMYLYVIMAYEAQPSQLAAGFEAKGDDRLAAVQWFSPEHTKKLQGSALSSEQIANLQWSSFHNGQLQIRYLKPDGTAELCSDGKPFARVRLSQQEIEGLKREGDKRPGKYRSPKGEGCRIYHSHLAIKEGGYKKRLDNLFVPLRITEGEIKTEAATVHDRKRVTIGIGGVNSWVDRYDGGEESAPLVDFDEIPLQGREVRLCFDSDLDKPQVLSALKKLAEFLASKGARVLIEVLPHGLDGDRLGVDDLIHLYGPKVFLEIAAIARSPFKERKVATKEGLILYRDWIFTGEPLDTRERNTYLAGLIGPHWRRSSDGKDRWQHWNGRHWEEVIGDDEITAAIESFAHLQGWQNRELNTIRSLQAAFRRTISRSADHQQHGLIPFANGCLRLTDRAWLPHNPQHGNKWALPYSYNSLADCPSICAFLADRLGDDASIALFRGFARTLLTGDRVKAFLEISGASNTGKSVLTNLLIALVGGENHTACALQRIEDRSQRFETLKLRGKRLAVFSECQDYSGQLQTLKAITGGDSIAAEIKGGRHLDITFTGGVVLTGNGPIRASDPTGAVINRRRSLHVGKVVAAADERELLEPDGNGGWRGDLVGELPGFINWVLAMSAAEARSALSRDVQSISRIEAELQSLLETDYLAEWANQSLIFDPKAKGDSALSVGIADGDADRHLFPSYLRFMAQQGGNTKPLALRAFKGKLVDLLRDTLALALPPGNTSTGDYRDRQRGSLVPCLRWRTAVDADAPGVIRHAFLARLQTPIAVMDQPTPEMDERWIGDGKNPVGDGWDGWDGSEESPDSSNPIGAGKAPHADPLAPIGEATDENPSPSIPSVPHKGFDRLASVTNHPPIHHAGPDPSRDPSRGGTEPPSTPGKPIRVDGQSGWLLPSGTLPRSSAQTLCVLVIDPKGQSQRIERRRITADAA